MEGEDLRINGTEGLLSNDTTAQKVAEATANKVAEEN